MSLLSLLASLAGLAVQLPGPDGPPLFTNEHYGIDGQPGKLVATDLTDDGRADLAILSFLETGISVLVATPTGRLETSWTHDLPGVGSSIDAADVTGDGWIDLLVGGEFDTIALLVGRGDGTFEPRDVAGLPSSESVRAVDLDGDDVLDILAIASSEPLPTPVVFLRGLGGGAFADPVDLDLELIGSTQEILIGDIDGDDELDLVIRAFLAGPGASVPLLTFIGDGALGFESKGLVELQAQPPTFVNRVQLADTNADGRDDLVVSRSGALEILQGQPDGQFEGVYQEAPGATAGVWDIDADGLPELAVVRNTLEIRRGIGPGEWESVGAGPWSGGVLTFADVQGDGVLDRISALGPAGYVFATPATARATLAMDRRTAAGPGLRVVSLDADGDGNLDLLTGISGPSGETGLRLLRGNGRGGFAAPLVTVIPDVLSELLVCNADDDGEPEVMVVVADYGTLPAIRRLVVVEFAADGMPMPGMAFEAQIEQALVCGDLDGDGLMDLAGVAVGRTDVAWRRGLGDGSFEDAVVVGSFVDPVQAVDLVDLDGDADLDLIVAGKLPGTSPADGVGVTTLLNDGGAAFAAVDTFGACEHFTFGRALVSGDLTGDDLPDVVLVTTTDLCLLPNVGNGGLGPVEPIESVNDDLLLQVMFHGRAELADLDGDGAADIVIGPTDVSGWTDAAQVWFQDGAGNLGPPTLYGSGNLASDWALGDFDNDGGIDIGLVSRQLESVGVLINRHGLFTRWSSPVGADVPQLVGTIVNEELRTLAVDQAAPGLLLVSFAAPGDDQDLIALPDQVAVWGGNPISWRADTLPAPVWVQAWFPGDGGDVQPSTVVRIRPD